MPNTCVTPCAASVSTKASLADILVIMGVSRFRVHKWNEAVLRLSPSTRHARRRMTDTAWSAGQGFAGTVAAPSFDALEPVPGDRLRQGVAIQRATARAA